MAVAQLAVVTLDCADQDELAEFWAALLDGEAVYRSADAIVLKTQRGLIAATRVPDYRPPTWPGGDTPKHIHLDLAVDDLDTAEAEALALGARKAEEQPKPERFRVLLDPAGHPFCLVADLPLIPLGPQA
jgi:Glyoxalase-like domain